MRKSVKKFLIISQILSWSALLASACTDDQVNTTVQNNVSNSGSQDGAKSSEDSSTKIESTDSNQTQHITKVGTPLTYTLPEGTPPKSDSPPSNGDGDGIMHEGHSEATSGEGIGDNHPDQTKEGSDGRSGVAGAGTPAASTSGSKVKKPTSGGNSGEGQSVGSAPSASNGMGDTPPKTSPDKTAS